MTMNSTQALPLALPQPMGAGSLEAYIQSVNRLPLLSLEQEQAFARRWREQNDVEAARELVLSHLRLVVAVARGYLGYGLPHADLIQEGNVGLMKAVKRFDPERGVRLVSFAIHWIKAEMHEYILRNWRLVKVATTKAQRKLFFNLRSMKRGLAPLGAAGLQRALAALDARSRRIVETRWLKEKNQATLHELAAEFKVSAERIRQIEAKALEKMKKVMQSAPALPAPRAA